MMANASAIIRHADADVWITSKNIQTFDFALSFPEERINRVRSLREMEWAEKILLWCRSSGTTRIRASARPGR